jgi:aryl-alcohol dehydrogenase (NADP+)
MQHAAEANGWTRFVSMQNHYNLIYREEEREMLPLCQDQGVGVIPWSPLARGRLTRAWDTQTARSETDQFGASLYRDEDAAVVTKVLAVAERRGVVPAQVALAWLLAQPAVTSPIVGITRPEHLTDAVAAVDLTLDDDEVAELGEGYVPHAIAGHR